MNPDTTNIHRCKADSTLSTNCITEGESQFFPPALCFVASTVYSEDNVWYQIAQGDSVIGQWSKKHVHRTLATCKPLTIGT